jgi:hypothetical protein
MIWMIPLLTVAFALEPANPITLCERFLAEKDVQNCKVRTEKDSVDWYAAAVCNLQKENDAFWGCWKSVENRKISPLALAPCTGNEEFTDDQRQACVNQALGERAPASVKSNGPFQPLKVKGSR